MKASLRIVWGLGLWASTLLNATSLAHAAPKPLPSIVQAEDDRKVDAPVLRDAVASPWAARRARAAVAYGRIQLPAGIDPLLQLSRDGDAKVREAAAFALGQLAWSKSFNSGRTPEIISGLARLKRDPKSSVRAVAAQALGKIAGLEAPGQLAPLLADPNFRVRAQALMGLYKFRQILQMADPSVALPLLPETIAQTVAGLASDRHPEVRRYVAFYWSRVKDPRSAGSVANLSRDPDAQVRLFAASALGRQGEASGKVALHRLLQDRSPLVRVAAVRAFAALKSTQEIPVILTQDFSFHVRATLAEAWSADSHPETLSLLRELMSDSSGTVRAIALSGTVSRSLDPSANPPIPDTLYASLQSSLIDPSWVIREAAVRAASPLPKRIRAPIDLQGARDLDVHVRTAALEGLADVDSSEAFFAITQALSSSELSERGTAVSSLANRTETDSLSQAWATYLRSPERRWISLREQVVTQVAKVPSVETTAELQVALADSASSVALKARDALEARGQTGLPAVPPSAFTYSPYRALHFSHNPVVRIRTTRGNFTLELFPRAARIHVANFVGLASSGFYDGLPWHRVISNFVIQGGDPDKTGWGDGGYELRAEINPLPFRRGSLGMPRGSGFDTGGVQLFVNHVPTPTLDGLYTVFGQVISGMAVVDRIETGDLVLGTDVLHREEH